MLCMNLLDATSADASGGIAAFVHRVINVIAYSDRSRSAEGI